MLTFAQISVKTSFQAFSSSPGIFLTRLQKPGRHVFTHQRTAWFDAKPTIWYEYGLETLANH